MFDISPRGTLRAAATAITDQGQVLAWASFKNRHIEYLWQQGRVTDFGRYFVPIAINDRGQVTGMWRKPGWLRRHVGLWQDGTITDLGPTDEADESAINARGDVIFERVNGATHRAVLWHSGKLTDLGDLGGGWTFSAAINDRSQIVGTSTLPGSKPQDHHAAFVWQDGKMTQLPGSDLGGPETYAGAINDRGDIVGTSCYGAGDCAGHILLWTYER
jgi:probable HAF family extracellular repeat protein